MLSIHDRPVILCDRISRREVLRAGGLGMLGLSLPNVLRATGSAAPTTSATSTFGRAKNVIFLYLQGGPSQHETFDPKPDAPAEIRGVFNPISTNVPGIQFCELLPRTARMADKLVVVRSMATDDNIHSSSGAWVLSGYKYLGRNARTIQPTDWPWFGSIIKRYKPSETLPALSAVWIPDLNRLNENVTPAGQTGGMMGTQWNPERFIGDPSDPSYRLEGLDPRIRPLRFAHRRRLLDQLEQHLRTAETSAAVDRFDTYQQQAFDLMTSGAARRAFAIGDEPDTLRERYGRNRWGQCVLLARRLIESGVRLVHVQWPREPGDSAVDNPVWDTHAQNHDRMEDVLCPMFDVGFTALIEDLDQRGLLDETLVVAIGEFGRTPKINAKAGRDHWGAVFSFVMAGAGISGGQVHGSSDKIGGYPKTDRVEPGDLTATIFHLMGIDHRGTFVDPLGREHSLTRGEPIWKLLGSGPATELRTEPGGDVARVPPFDPKRLLMSTDFRALDVLKPPDSPSRPKGWRAAPSAGAKSSEALGVWLTGGDDSSGPPRGQHAAIGFGLEGGTSGSPLKKGTGSEHVRTEDDENAPSEVPVPLLQHAASLSFTQGAAAYVAQEVRSPFAGNYRFAVQTWGDGSSREFYERVFLKHFTCRLVFFQYLEKSKRADRRRELASIEFVPKFVDEHPAEVEEFALAKRFANPTPGGNFSFGLGLGVAIIVEKRSEDVLELAGDGRQLAAAIHVESVQLDFTGKGLDEDVTV